MSVKYYIPFHDEDNNPCNIEFDIAGYEGDPIELEAVAEPLTISYNGSPDELFQQIITSKASVRLNYNAQFISDTRDIDDKDVPVTITYGSGLKWVGFLIADLRAETFDQTGYDVELTCVDPFSYLKESARTVLSSKHIYGLQSVADILKAIVSESIDLPINIQTDWEKVDGSSVISNVYCFIETLMEDGALPSGYDIIGKFMDTFCMQAVIVNGIVHYRNPRALVASRMIGITDRLNPEFLINNSEQVTRTRGIKQLGITMPYGEVGSLLRNGNFYFVDYNSLPGFEFSEWDYIKGGDYSDVTVLPPGISNPDNRGVIIKGFAPSGFLADHSLTSSSHFLSNEIFIPPVVTTLQYFLEIKYRYSLYDTSQPAQLFYMFMLTATFNNGDIYSYYNDGVNGSDKLGQWQQVTGSQQRYMMFKLEPTNAESTFQIIVSTDALDGFPNNLGTDWVFGISLFPIATSQANSDFYSQHGNNDSALSDEINIISVDFRDNKYKIGENNEDYPTDYLKMFQADTTRIRNNKRYSKVNDDIEVPFGAKFNAGNTFVSQDKKMPYTWSNGSLMNNDGSFIGNFVANGQIEKLITLNARDRMYFLRHPRNMIDLELRSSQLSFTDVLEFPGVIGGKYIQLSDEYNVERCEHHLNVMELSGYDDQNDIIENYLSSE